jgi:hypothetical protein
MVPRIVDGRRAPNAKVTVTLSLPDAETRLLPRSVAHGIGHVPTPSRMDTRSGPLRGTVPNHRETQRRRPKSAAALARKTDQ